MSPKYEEMLEGTLALFNNNDQPGELMKTGLRLLKCVGFRNISPDFRLV